MSTLTAAWPMAPELPANGPEYWINSPPLTLAQHRGRPVLIEFWTFDCRGCRRSVSWMNSLHRRHSSDMAIISVHTPESLHERGRAQVLRRVEAFDIRFPVMLDNDMRYWNTMGNRYWPAFYLVNPQGRIQGAWAGEVLEGSARAAEIEAAISGMLTQGGPPGQ